MDLICYSSFTILFVALILLLWFLYERYKWYRDVISQNPERLIMKPVLTKKMMTEDNMETYTEESPKVMAPRCTFQQYIKYLWLACLPYGWSVPMKYVKHIYLRQFRSKLSEIEKRQRLAKMVLETSLVLGFDKKCDQEGYLFVYKNFRMPTIKENTSSYNFICECQVTVILTKENIPILDKILIDGSPLIDLNEMFSFLNTLWCVYTHTLTHVHAGNIAEVNKSDQLLDDDVGLKESIDDMHAAAAGMNESANHYPADIWGITRNNLQAILGYNSVQKLTNHHKIFQCKAVSNFVSFTIRARNVFRKYLSEYKIDISTLSANTIFHSIDHYNMGKYFLQDSTKKQYLGVDSRMITAILGDLNYDLGRWQGMKYTKYKIWKSIYRELKEIDEELADKVHMFISV